MGRRFIAVIAFFFVVISMAHSHLLSPSQLSETPQAGKNPTSPWPCCDNCGGCTKSIPPICNCLDLVPSCHPECQSCVESDQSTYDTPLYQCMDHVRDYCKFKCTCGASILNH